MLCFIQCNKDDDLHNGVNISDDNFIQALINRGYDLNNDSIISKDEIEAITFLNLNDANISDLSGIEDFINLETLWCNKNSLSLLDISQNSKLKLLDCRSNNIRYLNIDNPVPPPEIFNVIENFLFTYNAFFS